MQNYSILTNTNTQDFQFTQQSHIWHSKCKTII